MRVAFPLVLLAVTGLPEVAGADMMQASRQARSGAFDATGDIRCAQEVGQLPGPCRAAAARAGDSTAIIVTFPNGFARMLMFSHGDFLRGNATMSGVGTDTEWRLTDGIYHIRVDDQRFELPRSLVVGD